MSNATPTIGDNTQVDFAAIETDRLNGDYAELVTSVEDLVEEANKIALPIVDDEGKGIVAAMIKRLRDTTTRVEGIREIEKLPHLRRGNAVDQFFGGLRLTLRKDNKRDRDAVGDVLQSALTTYDAAVLAKEMERRRLEAERAAREAAEKQAAEEKARREAEEKRLAAERARLPETKEQKGQAADDAEVAASEAFVEAKAAETVAEDKHVATLARPADVMRQRAAGGIMTTMAQENFSEVVDRDALDLTKLRGFFKLEHLEQAVRAYAASNGYSSDEKFQIAGARFGKRPKSVVR